ncbi:MAG: cyclic nucleotide-binding domain-containing protein [Nitrospiraceae bacterium]|nr:cyclic nucleotide-binding domain-containing protein [Nitrospiraceae bacterium]
MGPNEKDRFSKSEESFRKIDIGVEERAELLDKTQWARDFDWRQITSTVQFLKVMKAPKGAILFMEGVVESFMFIILEGTVRIEKEDEKGNKKTVAILGPGQMLGEMSLFNEEPRSATAVAVKEITVLFFRKEDFDRMSKEKPFLSIQVLTEIIKLMGERLRRTSGVLADYL